MGEIAIRQAMLHGVIAAAVVEAVLLTWRIRAPEWRLAFWLVALACPFVLPPVFLAAVPVRTDDAFTAGRALFSSQRWSDVRVGGLGVDAILFDVLAACGLLLFLRDGGPMVMAAWRERRVETRPTPVPGRVRAIVAKAAGATRVHVPDVVVLPADAPILFVRGVRRHTVVCSEGALARLSDEQLRAALAHELAHVRSRDPLAGWLLMAARLIMFWNPAVQLVGRAIVQEMEHRADAAAMQTADGSSFVTVLRTLVDRPPSGGGRSRLGVLVGHAHRAHVRRRLDWIAEPRTEVRFARTRLALVASTLAVLLFFVV